MTVIEVTNPPVIVQEKAVKQFEVSKIYMLTFAKLYNETSSLVSGGGKPWIMQNKRLRIRHQCKAVSESGEKLTLSDMDISQLPIVYARQIDAALANDEAQPGKIVGNGDGIATPILYQLGTPIKAKQAGGEEVAITELEFLAHTFGDVEEVMAETDQINQTVALIRQVAKPLGASDTLQRLPEWALERISMADAFDITEKVLPRFLG